ncbi:MAG: Pvc16 family protein [Terrimicrobiaceae bacterium]
MPPQVGVSTLPPAQAEKFRTRAGILARVNVALYQVSPEHRLRNISRASPGSSPAEEPPPAKLVLGYLITAYGKAAPEQEHSVERLLEAAHDAIHRMPILTALQLAAAMPASAGPRPNIRAAISLMSMTNEDTCRLFSAMRAECRPALFYVVRYGEQ